MVNGLGNIQEATVHNASLARKNNQTNFGGSKTRALEVLELSHSDSGTIRTQTYGGEKNYFVFIDDFQIYGGENNSSLHLLITFQ